MKQLLLLPSPKPLRDRLGETFFRSVPRCPGVYIMTGEEERVLYIGQSKNLRARLATYKNATRDRSPRKVVQLVHQVRNVVWEKCDSSEASKTREAALLRVHRPKFNVIGTWQLSPRYVVIRASEDCLELDCTTKAPTKTGRTVGGEEAPMERQVFGPFKSSVIAFYGVFLRLIWSAVNLPDSPAEFQAG